MRFPGQAVDLRPAHDNGIAHAWRQIAERGGEAVVVTGGGGGEDVILFGRDCRGGDNVTVGAVDGGRSQRLVKAVYNNFIPL